MADEEVNSANGALPAIIGTCGTFCPKHEHRSRQKDNLLSICEGGAWPSVTAYSRSAAGTYVNAEDVRTPACLFEVVRYLFVSVLPRDDVDLLPAYAFISDRLRAARKEAAVQRHTSLPWLRCCLSSLRFHITASYAFAGVRMAGQDEDGWGQYSRGAGADYDDSVNDQRLIDTLGRAFAVASALQSFGTGSENQRDEVAVAMLELACVRLMLALQNAQETVSALRDGSGSASILRSRLTPQSLHLRPESIVSMLNAWHCCKAITTSWHSGHYYGAIRAIDALMSSHLIVETCVQSEAARLSLRCLAHRHLPLARARLLCALSAAIPAQRPLPLHSLSAFTRQRGNIRQRVAAETVGIPGRERQLEVGVEEPSQEEEPAWFATARMCMQLKLRVQGPPVTAQGPAGECTGEASAVAPAPWTSRQAVSRCVAWRKTPPSRRETEAGDPGLAVAFDKATGAALEAQLSSPAVFPLPLRLALTPLREDSSVLFPSRAQWADMLGRELGPG